MPFVSSPDASLSEEILNRPRSSRRLRLPPGMRRPSETLPARGAAAGGRRPVRLRGPARQTDLRGPVRAAGTADRAAIGPCPVRPGWTPRSSRPTPAASDLPAGHRVARVGPGHEPQGWATASAAGWPGTNGTTMAGGGTARTAPGSRAERTRRARSALTCSPGKPCPATGAVLWCRQARVAHGIPSHRNGRLSLEARWAKRTAGVGARAPGLRLRPGDHRVAATGPDVAAGASDPEHAGRGAGRVPTTRWCPSAVPLPARRPGRRPPCHLPLSAGRSGPLTILPGVNATSRRRPVPPRAGRGVPSPMRHRPPGGLPVGDPDLPGTEPP